MNNTQAEAAIRRNAGFAARVMEHLEESAAIREGLHHEGARIIARILSHKRISLRELARRTGLSATYLCAISYGKQISPGAYIKLAIEEVRQ